MKSSQFRARRTLDLWQIRKKTRSPQLHLRVPLNIQLATSHSPLGCEYEVNPNVSLRPPRAAAEKKWWRPGSRLVWIKHPLSGITYPLELDPQNFKTVKRLQSDLLQPHQLPAKTLQAFLDAGLLKAHDSSSNRVMARKELLQNGYTILRNITPAPLADALRVYYDERIARGDYPFGDRRVSRRYVDFNDPVTEYLLDQFRSVIEEVCGVKLKSVYHYFIGYREGAALKKHTDQSNCEVVASIQISYRKNGKLSSSQDWPLYLYPNSNRPVQLRLQPGDAAVFFGTQIPHGRPELPKGCSSDSVLINYVKK